MSDVSEHKAAIVDAAKTPKQDFHLFVPHRLKVDVQNTSPWRDSGGVVQLAFMWRAMSGFGRRDRQEYAAAFPVRDLGPTAFSARTSVRAPVNSLGSIRVAREGYWLKCLDTFRADIAGTRVNTRCPQRGRRTGRYEVECSATSRTAAPVRFGSRLELCRSAQRPQDRVSAQGLL
jgi:hypothetical protein